MKSKRLLFVCGKARMRSPTAADLLQRQSDIETRCAGTSNDAGELIAREDIDWAGHIYCMQPVHRKKL